MELGVNIPLVIHPHHQKDMENWIVQVLPPHQTELLQHLTVVGPELIVVVKIHEDIILPTLPSLKRIHVLLPWKDHPMETLLRNLKGRVSKQQHHHSTHSSPSNWRDMAYVH